MTQSTEKLDKETEAILHNVWRDVEGPYVSDDALRRVLRSRIRELVSEARKEGAEDVRRRMEQIKSWEAPR